MNRTPDSRLHLAVADLLQHHRGRDPLPLVVVEGPHGGFGIAAVLDGYYSQHDAAEMIRHWQVVLDRALGELDAHEDKATTHKTWTKHRCTRQHRTFNRLVRCMIARAAWVGGEGPYALIAWCDVPTVTLWTDPDRAEAKRDFIDRTRCGGRCTGRHEVVELRLGGDAA